MPKRQPPGKPVRRQQPKPKTLQLLVFTEGISTEVSYLKRWHSAYRSFVTVEIGTTHGDPKTIVQAAADAKRAAKRQERRNGSPHDEYWCMFDVDEHGRIAEALDQAQANEINIALSNPCIELWFMLHFQEQTAHIHRHDAQSVCRSHLSCDKTLSPEALDALFDRYEDARKRALDLAKRHEGNGSPPNENPSSSMPAFGDRILNAAA